MRSLILAFVIACSATGTAAHTAAAQADTIPRRQLFGWKDAAILEGFAIVAVALAPLDTRLAERLQDSSVQENRLARNAATFVETVTEPGSALIGLTLYVGGRITKNEKAADLGLHGTEALFIGAQIGNVLKGLVGRARPYVDVTEPHDYQTLRGFTKGTDYRSFPSGHSIAAFAAASAVTAETSRWWPRSVWIVAPIMYGGATATAWSRMFDNKHWASDVITGAAIGTFAGLKVVQWHHMHPGNAVDRILLGARVATAPDGSTMVLANVRF